MSYKHCSEGHLMDPSWKYCPVCLAPLAGWLVEIGEDRPKTVHTVHLGKSFIGSGVDAEIRILDSSLSRLHAYLVIVDGVCTIVDLGNGKSIEVNDMVTVKSTLIDGDLVLLGDSLFKIKLL